MQTAIPSAPVSALATSPQLRFLARIERFLKRSGLSATGLGREALGDTSFVHRLRVGREARSSTQLKVERFMREYAQ